MKKLLLATTLLLSSTAHATLEPEQECELYMQLYEIVAQATGEEVSDTNPVHRGLMAAVLTLTNELQLQESPNTDLMLDNVRRVVTEVTSAPGGISCSE